MRYAKRNAPRIGYRVRDAVQTVQGEGVVKFVFPQDRNGKTAYAVNFANRRLGVIFHEHELAPGSGEFRSI